MNALTKLSDSELRVRVAEVVKLRDAATGGKWSVVPYQFDIGNYIVTDAHELIRERWVVDKVELSDNAMFIAASHTSVDLLQELARRVSSLEMALRDCVMWENNGRPTDIHKATWDNARAAIANAGAHKEGQTDE